MKKEYAFNGHTLGGSKTYWSDGYRTASAARRDAKEWIGGINARRADILECQPLPPGHELGATWRIVDALDYGGRKQ